MGRRGPQKKLPVLEYLDGNPSKKLIQASGVEALGEPFVPEHLCDDARGCIEVIKASMPPSVYSALDSFLLAAFALAWAIHKKAALEISNPDFQWMVENGQGTIGPNAWIKVASQQAVTLASLGDRLGLDPKSRMAIKAPGSRQQRSKFDGLLHGQPPALLTDESARPTE